VPHQANLRIIEAVVKRAGVPMERCFVNVQRYGNMSAATVPVALVECLDGCQGSFILSNYPQDFTPPENWHKVEIPITSSASGKGKVGADRSKMPTQASLGDRRRTEVLWWVDRSANARADVQRLYQKIKEAA
jgi:hypothetical protein